MPPPIWTTHSSRTLHADRWIHLRADHCVTPNGKEISPYYVLEYPDWVHVVALTQDDRLVLVRQYRHAVGESLLELPGGAMDACDAKPEDTARRELLEETGFAASELHHICTLYPNPATHTNRLHIYLTNVSQMSGKPQLEPGEEGMSVHLVPIHEVLNGLRSGFVGQAMHVSGILLGLVAAGRISLG